MAVSKLKPNAYKSQSGNVGVQGARQLTPSVRWGSRRVAAQYQSMVVVWKNGCTFTDRSYQHTGFISIDFWCRELKQFYAPLTVSYLYFSSEILPIYPTLFICEKE